MRLALLAAASCGVAVAVALAACGGGGDGDPRRAPVVGADASAPTPGDAGPPAVVDAGLDAAPDAGPPAVRFVGRFDTSDPAGPMVGWPGARILARFDGTEVKVTLGDASYGGGRRGRWDVIVDGATLPAPLVASEGVSTYPLASGLAPGVHTIELWRRTEAMVSNAQFLGFDFGAGKLLPPPPPRTRRLEFLTDSAGNGYGIEGSDPSCSFSADTQNEHRSYPALMAIDLDADHHHLGFQGRGVYWNYVRTDPDVFGVVYPRTMPLSASPAWDFTRFEPDLVWITLGGNDYDVPSAGAPPPPLAGFQQKYADLVALVRQKHPAAHVVCAVSTSLQDAYPVGYDAYTSVKTALAAVVAAANATDPKVHYFEFTRAVFPGDLTGCEYHPNVQKHRKMADEAIAFVRSKTGWN
jgi:hypothetical protein